MNFLSGGFSSIVLTGRIGCGADLGLAPWQTIADF